MTIDLTKVSISLGEFQRLSEGAYNAGEVKLSGRHTLEKMNHHVDRTGANTVRIPHEEVLAIKQAFVRTLKRNGVDSNELNRVRQELGLAPLQDRDAGLRTRSALDGTVTSTPMVIGEPANA